MTQAIFILCAAAVSISMVNITNVKAEGSAAQVSSPIVIGHRGASGYVPEHTLASYFIAVEQGADFIEPDLVMTKDGVLVARHENEIGGTTNVAEISEFASRRTTKTIDGTSVTGWFTEDFTLAELKTLRARERIPQLRTGNTRFDNQFEIPTLDEVLELLRSTNEQRDRSARRLGKPKSRPVGVYPEIKHATYFDGLGLAMEKPLVHALHSFGYEGKHARAYIQSFEVANLQQLSRLTQVPLVQLIDSEGQPYDFVKAEDSRTYTDLLSAEGLRFIAEYADAVGIDKDLVIPLDSRGKLGTPSSLVGDAHSAGLRVHVWTLRAENHFLPLEFQRGDDPRALGDMAAEANVFLEAGVDGYFTDHPHIGVLARDAFIDAD